MTTTAPTALAASALPTDGDTQMFSFGDLSVRVVEQDGVVLFCGKDVAQALGYSNTNDALNKHCRGVAKRYPLMTSGGMQDVRFITEGDLYRLVASSKLPSAQRFESWVFDEVLPDVRRHGMYATPTTVEAMLNDPDSMIQALTAYKEERARRVEAELQRAAVEAKRKEEAPRVLFAESVESSKSSILVGELAKILKANGYDTGAVRLFETLRQQGFLIRRNGSDKNMPTQRSMEMGLFEIKESVIAHPDGHTTIQKTPKVTGKGQVYFVNRFCGPSEEN